MFDFSPVFPDVPEGYDLVRRDAWSSVPLPKPSMPEDILDLAQYANNVRAERFGRPLQSFGPTDLPTIRLLAEDDMDRWAGQGVLGQWNVGNRQLVVLKPEVVGALPNPVPDTLRAWGNDDRRLIAKSVLLHELVHWLQYREVGFDPAPIQKSYESLMNTEYEAWTAQALWLNEHGCTTSMFARLNDVHNTVDRLYSRSTREWFEVREIRRIFLGEN